MKFQKSVDLGGIYFAKVELTLKFDRNYHVFPLCSIILPIFPKKESIYLKLDRYSAFISAAGDTFCRPITVPATGLSRI